MANTYDALDFGLDPANTPSKNQAALQAAVIAAQNNNGGRILIPAFGAYPITSTIAISITDGSAISIVGSSGSALFLKSDGTDLFQVTNAGAGDGVLFQDLHVKYSGAFTSGVAFNFMRCQNGRLLRVILQDCPLGAVFTDCLESSVAECRSIYLSQNNATCVTLNTAGFGGTQRTRIYACDFDATSATGCTGLSVTQSTDLSVADTRFIGFQSGILIEPGSGQSVQRSVFRGVSCQTTGTAVTIKPASSTGTIQEVYLSESQFRPQGSPPASTPGVDIDINGGTNTQVDSIFLEACTAVGWPGPGVQVNRGQNVQVTGGRYSSNGASDAGSGGIALTAAATNVRIVGANCTGTLSGLAQQQNGIAVTNGATNVYIGDCDLTGNANAALYTSSPGSLAVVNCTGYNDKQTIVTTTPPGSGSPFNGASNQYYGPVAFYVSGGTGTQVLIDGATTGPTQGGFILNATALGAPGGTAPPSEFAEITYSGSPTFRMVGK